MALLIVAVSALSMAALAALVALAVLAAVAADWWWRWRWRRRQRRVGCVVVGAVCCAGLMTTLPRIARYGFVAWLVLGAVVYFGYGVRRSNLQQSLS